MRILVTGREGQLARSMIERGAERGIAVTALGRPEFDLGEPEGVAVRIAAAAPDIVVNAAAYTAVDKAESEPGLALAINAAGAGAVARAAAGLGVPIIQISTDYVFDGSSATPYRPDDATAPLGAYGRSKLAGEQAVAAATPAHAILRTAWVYSPFGGNFVKTMLRLARSRDEVSVVADQIGCPTNALDLADGVLDVAQNLVARSGDPDLWGIFHMTGTGETSWAGFAEAVFEASRRLGGPHARVRPITTADYPTPARRPANSRLDGTTLARHHGVVLPPWQHSLERCVARLLKESEA